MDPYQTVTVPKSQPPSNVASGFVKDAVSMPVLPNSSTRSSRHPGDHGRTSLLGVYNDTAYFSSGMEDAPQGSRDAELNVEGSLRGDDSDPYRQATTGDRDDEGERVQLKPPHSVSDDWDSPCNQSITYPSAEVQQVPSRFSPSSPGQLNYAELVSSEEPATTGDEYGIGENSLLFGSLDDLTWSGSPTKDDPVDWSLVFGMIQ